MTRDAACCHYPLGLAVAGAPAAQKEACATVPLESIAALLPPREHYRLVSTAVAAGAAGAAGSAGAAGGLGPSQDQGCQGYT